MKETKYTPLTKKIIDADGNIKIVCAFEGTEKCPKLHSTSKSINADHCCVCPVITAMMELLNTFEEIYMQPEGNTDGKPQSI